MKSVNWPKPGYASITCSTISNIPYNLIFTTKFNDSSILISIISYDYLHLSLADEHVGDVTISRKANSLMASLVKPRVTWFSFENVDIFVGHENHGKL